VAHGKLVEFGAELFPVGEMGFDEVEEPFVVKAFEKVYHFVDKDVFEAVLGLFSEFKV
jgi:hypothetical protein